MGADRTLGRSSQLERHGCRHRGQATPASAWQCNAAAEQQQGGVQHLLPTCGVSLLLSTAFTTLGAAAADLALL